MSRSSKGEAVVPLVRSVLSIVVMFSFAMFFFCALVARCAEDESVAAQDVGGTRNVKHHGQQKEQMYHFDMFR